MLEENALSLLREGLAAFGLDETRAALLGDYLSRVLEKNKVMNLTAITDPADAVRLHLLDCATLCAQYTFAGKSVIDVGCGAGLPGLPIRILEPTVHLTLLDATEKKIEFLRETAAALALANVRCIAARAEEAVELREVFDVAVSRAVAPLNILSELCLPFVRVGGLFCAMKAKAADEELREAARAIQLMGGTVRESRDYTIPGTYVTHRAIWIEKVSITPAGYPRRYAKIKQRPL
ncbi:MAG: 16S rRNA (guanine(527)-N(7))-methyltransferase RsmG [Clostridiaceae bacterium]|nr:16S rRNA (guanine(527)-N(7))-methyltransferase RsmG [Clostridiaceae bacterium]